MADEAPFRNYDELSEARILVRAHQEVDRALSRASQFLQRIQDYEKDHLDRASILSELDTMMDASDDFTSRWSELWTSRWGAPS